MGYFADKWGLVKDMLSLRTEHRLNGLQDIQTLHKVHLSLNVGTKDDHKQSFNAVLDAMSILFITLAFFCCTAGLYMLMLTVQMVFNAMSGVIAAIFIIVPPAAQSVLRFLLYIFSSVGVFKICGKFVHLFQINAQKIIQTVQVREQSDKKTISKSG